MRTTKSGTVSNSNSAITMSGRFRVRREFNMQAGLRTRLLQSRLAESVESPVDSSTSVVECRGIQMRELDLALPNIKDSKDSGVGETRDDFIETASHYSNASAPCSPTPKLSQLSEINTRGLDYNRLMIIPPNGPFVNLTPRPLRKAVSARCLSELSPPSPVGSIGRRYAAASEYGDSISAINIPTGFTQNEASEETKTRYFKRNLSRLLSGVYAIFLITFGGILYISELRESKRAFTEAFSTVISLIGIIWLVFLHADLWRYKREVLKQLKEREDAMQEAGDRISTATEFVFNSGYVMATTNFVSPGGEDKPKTPPYRFLVGRHSGSFYLKIGMAAFCFGNLIYEGLQLGQHILNFVDYEKKLMDCSRTTSVALHIFQPLYAFYQLFITFKYSNVVINRHKAIARVGLMHLIATCLCFWFNTIVEEAVLDYHHKSNNSTHNTSCTEFDVASYHVVIERKGNWINPYHCTADSVLSTRSMEAIPYLYPFAIEYNLLLAGVWFIMWQNIGQEHHPSNPHHIRHTISQDEDGGEEIAYQSNLVISADCHASNKGLFMGLFILLTTIVTVIVFFVAMTTKGYQQRAVRIHTGQEGILVSIGMISVIVCFVQLKKLDINSHPITFLDDVLMFVPLPFYFIHGLMSIIAEFSIRNYTRLAVHTLMTIEVIVQTTFIIDGLRRCSNAQVFRYKKPGREILTFLIILNLTLWIVNTFELKSVEKFHGQEKYYGDFIWMFISHATVPVMLFYRFHSSVCLADMWKSAYEKES